jgi:hypothetical protein
MKQDLKLEFCVRSLRYFLALDNVLFLLQWGVFSHRVNPPVGLPPIDGYSLVYIFRTVAAIVTVAILHESRSQQNRTTLQHEQRSPGEWRQLRTRSVATVATLWYWWLRAARQVGWSSSVALKHAIWWRLLKCLFLAAVYSIRKWRTGHVMATRTNYQCRTWWLFLKRVHGSRKKNTAVMSTNSIWNILQYDAGHFRIRNFHGD